MVTSWNRTRRSQLCGRQFEAGWRAHGPVRGGRRAVGALGPRRHKGDRRAESAPRGRAPALGQRRSEGRGFRLGLRPFESVRYFWILWHPRSQNRDLGHPAVLQHHAVRGLDQPFAARRARRLGLAAGAGCAAAAGVAGALATAVWTGGSSHLSSTAVSRPAPSSER